MGDTLQLGRVFTRAQAIAAGVDPRQLSRHRGLERPFPGVYAAGPLGYEEWLLAACLWSGGVASHRAAGRLYGIEECDEAPLEVTVPLERNPKSRRVRVHRAAVPIGDGRVLRGISVTSPVRTLIDLAGVLNRVSLAIAVESAWRTGLVPPAGLERALERLETRGRDGAENLRRVLDDCATRGRPFDSALEVRFWWLLKRFRFRRPVPGYEVRDEWGQPMRLDFAYPEQGVAVETNGRKFHGLAQFERDNFRLSRIGASHWFVLHVTKLQLEKPAQVLGILRDALRPVDAEKVIVNDEEPVPAGVVV